MPLVDLCLNLLRFEWVMTSLWRHLSVQQTIVHISNYIEPTNFILGTMYNYIRYIYWLEWKWPWHKLKITGEGQRSQKWINGHILQTISFTEISYLEPRHNTISDISFLDLEARSRSRSYVNVESHRRGGVCVLWMLLVLRLLYWLKKPFKDTL